MGYIPSTTISCYLSSNTTPRSFQESTSDLVHYILPYILLWNLIQQYVTTYGVRPVCMQENCAGLLVLKCSKMGQTHSLQPRIQHDCKCTVLLVTALYSCLSVMKYLLLTPGLCCSCLRSKYPLFCCKKQGL